MSQVTRANSKLKFQTADVPSQADFEDLHDSVVWYDESPHFSRDILTYRGLGSTLIGEVVGTTRTQMDNTTDLVDTLLVFLAIYLPLRTATGVEFLLSTAGVFTGDNENAIGLYTLSGTTLTKVAATANDANIWKTSGGGIKSVAFGTPYNVVTAGTHFLAVLYNNSAQTTAPNIGIVNMLGTASSLRLTTDIKIISTVSPVSALPSTQAFSALSQSSGHYYFGVYE